MEYKYLFSPVKIGSALLKNRIFLAPHGTSFSEDNILDDRYVEYLRMRAQGGVGMIIAGGMTILPNSMDFLNIQEIYDERAVPMLKKLAAAVQQYGTRLVVQIVHVGRQMESGFSREPIWAPSPIPCPVVRETPKEMEIEDIKKVVRAFAHAAKLAQKGGLDGVEIHGSTGYMFTAFMSPYTNQRTDEYGGSLENRMRFPLEVIDAVREAVGRDFIVGIRVPGDELVPGGLTLADMKGIAQRIEATGKIDYIHIGHAPWSPTFAVGFGMQVPLGFNSAYAAQFKEVVDLPILNTFRINDPVQAEKILADGQGDLVGMVRALIADPELPNKAREGRLEEIRSCIACNQGCFGRLFEGKSLSCLQNPVVGLEKEIGTLEPARVKKKVVIVGGGPAGMETARVAALRGHAVTLHEKAQELGGQVNIAVKAPIRSEFGGITRYLIKQMDMLGVTVNLGTEATPELVMREKPDVVIIATGSQPLRPPLPGGEQDNVLTARDVLQGKAVVGERVLVVDGGEAHWQCLSTAEYLAEQGKKVEIITPLPFVGMGVANTVDLPAYCRRAKSLGVVFTPDTALMAIAGDRAVVLDTHTYQERYIEGVDTVVLVTGNRAENRLYRDLKGKIPELYMVGDCLAPRKAIDAIYDGYVRGRMI